MIYTEVYVPSIDKRYDFKLNEDVPAHIVIAEISSVICQKEHCNISGDQKQLLLFKESDYKVLSLNLTLYENDVRTGSKLVLC